MNYFLRIILKKFSTIDQNAPFVSSNIWRMILNGEKKTAVPDPQRRKPVQILRNHTGPGSGDRRNKLLPDLAGQDVADRLIQPDS